MGLFNKDVDIDNFKVSNTDNVSTTSSSYVLMPDMTITPGPGTWFVTFSAKADGTDMDQDMRYALHIDAVIILHTERKQNLASSFPSNLEEDKIDTQDTVTLAAGEAINVRFKTDSGTFNVHARSLIAVLIES